MKIKTLEKAELYYDVEYEIELNLISKELKDKIFNNNTEEKIELLKEICEKYGIIKSSETDGNADNFRIEEIREINL